MKKLLTTTKLELPEASDLLNEVRSQRKKSKIVEADVQAMLDYVEALNKPNELIE